MVINPKIKAGVIWGGVVASYPDLLTNWRRSSGAPGEPVPTASTSRGWRSGWINMFGSPEENPEFWRTVSSNSYLDDLSGPVQLHHAQGDTSVPVVLSEILNEEIQQAGGTVEMYIYPGDNHNISENFGTAMTRTIQFFNRYLKGEGG
jgi:dipeptidyl aminopeptidase/acylaminoacyl peptidase